MLSYPYLEYCLAYCMRCGDRVCVFLVMCACECVCSRLCAGVFTCTVCTCACVCTCVGARTHAHRVCAAMCLFVLALSCILHICLLIDHRGSALQTQHGCPCEAASHTDPTISPPPLSTFLFFCTSAELAGQWQLCLTLRSTLPRKRRNYYRPRVYKPMNCC